MLEKNIAKYPHHYVFKPWTERGVCHGFIGSQHDFGERNIEAEVAPLCRSFNVPFLFAPRQVHGTDLFELERKTRLEILKAQAAGSMRINPGSFDGVVFEHVPEAPCLFAVRTADCLPVLVRGEKWSAVVHAGWRGLCSGIVEKAVRILKDRSPGKLEVLVGPAASGRAYEVGPEVLAEFEAQVVSRPSMREGYAYLSLAGTLEKRLAAEFYADLDFMDSGICTITDERFHSWRRQGGKGICPGNLSFLVG